MTDTVPPELQADLEAIEKTTKKGFDLVARLQGRGLRKSTITLYLDDDIGVELGYAHDVYDTFGTPQGRDRMGVLGEIDMLQSSKQRVLDSYTEALKTARALDGVGETAAEAIPEPDFAETDKQLAALEEKKAELLAKLTGTGIKVSMQAVPTKIRKDMRRRARDSLEITEKGIPESLKEEFDLMQTAHLMTVMFTAVTDIESGAVNDKTTVDDALALMDFLPPSQYARLDQEMGRVQFTDAISRDIESQEDFS